jgi:hypothetical protein
VDADQALYGLEQSFNRWTQTSKNYYSHSTRTTLMISRHHLIMNKKTAARLQDLADVQQLEATKD